MLSGFLKTINVSLVVRRQTGNRTSRINQPGFYFRFMDPEAANGTIAQEAYDRITELLHLDNGFDDLPSEDRLKQRQLVLKKKVDAYFELPN